jgi:Zn-dependent protease with chaperone function
VSSEKWFCQIDGETYGPFAGSELKQLVAEQRLQPGDMLRRGETGAWSEARRFKGLFDDAPKAAVATDKPKPAHAEPHAVVSHDNARLRSIGNVKICVSRAERKLRFTTALLSMLLWIPFLTMMVATLGLILIPTLLFYVAGEYFRRRVQALGVSVSPRQFPEVNAALEDVCRQFHVKRPPCVVLNGGGYNAFAMRFGSKPLIVLLVEPLEGVLDKPAELRFLIGHELGHVMLDFGSRRFLEIYRSAAFSAAREMTCDNVGLAASGDLQASKNALRRLVGGNKLFARLDEDELADDAARLRSGIWGWFLRQYSAYPPIGTRLRNVEEFAEKHG